MRQTLALFFFILATMACQGHKTKSVQTEKIPVICSVPDSLHLDRFYKKYMNANGIVIASSWRVPDSAMVQAWRIIKFMTDGLPIPVLEAMVKTKTRISVMARYEGTTDIPEHAYLASDTTLNWDLRARGLGGDMELPLTSCAEENLLAYQIDKYHAEDILIHEFAHSIHLIGIIQVDTTFNKKLEKLLSKAVSLGKYSKTYAKTDIFEYWAEGIQDWFNVNAEVPKPDGKHNRLNTRNELKRYDPDLYTLIHQYFTEFKGGPSKHIYQNLYKVNRIY